MTGGEVRPPTIGVLLPNYNDARYLPRCLRSMLDQPDPPDEILIVDDGSTDDSIAIIEAWMKTAPMAKLVRNPRNLGTFGAVAEGLRHARSDYLLFLAANDFLLPGIFERARQSLARAPGIGLWSAMAWLVDEQDQLVRLHPSAVVARQDAWLGPDRCVELAHRLGHWFTGTTLIYHRERLADVGGFDPEYGAPSDLITALAVASLYGAAYSPEPLAAIRIHAGSYSSRALQNLDGLDAMFARLRSRGPQLSPILFQKPFLDRMVQRYRSAAVRATQGKALEEVARRTGGARGRFLGFGARLLPRSFARSRSVVAFVGLRPYDLWPAFRYRLLGWIGVRLRSRRPTMTT